MVLPWELDSDGMTMGPDFQIPMANQCPWPDCGSYFVGGKNIHTPSFDSPWFGLLLWGFCNVLFLTGNPGMVDSPRFPPSSGKFPEPGPVFFWPFSFRVLASAVYPWWRKLRLLPLNAAVLRNLQLLQLPPTARNVSATAGAVV